jgi:possible ATP-dependent helicase hrpB (fragment)
MPSAAIPATTLSEAVALVAALARPEWIAHRRGPTPSAGEPAFYTSVGGAGMRTARGSALNSSPWLAVADVGAALGRGDASVRAAAPIDDELALSVGAPWLTEEERVVWTQGRLRSERLRRLGAITLTATPGGTPPPSAVAGAVVEACRAEGLDVLPWNEAGELRARLALLNRALGEPWPAMDDGALLDRAEQWLLPAVEALAASGRRFDLRRLDVGTALRALLPWPEASGLDELAPQRIEVPSGSRIRVSYVGEQGEALQRPVLAVRMQECFGWADTPRVVDGRVPVLIHLLSPARRPVAVTDDLRSFWAGPYRQVRAELRGRYPKHPWPEDPWTAPATRGTRRRG